ncbi:hypothetical protein [Burkholderia gladioli]|uniref:hypothetical protein n=1 Tax=Burkholderia gladioli TaxID=28095 RepID=UPI00163F6932|nr:hypothetical protein [Burkholderia gladioli]
MALILADEGGLQVEPLTADERAWARKLDTLLAKMPARLKLIEVDDTLVLVDQAGLKSVDDDSGFGAVRAAGAVLANLTGGVMKISGMTC